MDSGGRETAAALSVGEIESIADRFSADGSPQSATPPAEADDDDPSSIRRAQFGRFGHRVDGVAAKLATPTPVETGQLVHLSGMRLEVAGLRSPIGSVSLMPGCRWMPR